MHAHARQGDLLFITQDTQPEGALIARQGNVIVAGEVTGHAHRLRTGTILEAQGGALYLDVTQTIQVVHETGVHEHPDSWVHTTAM